MSKSNQKYRYRVSKRMFKYYNEENCNMLFGIGRMLCNAPFSNLFHQEIFPIRNKHNKLDIGLLEQKLLPNYLNFFYSNLHNRFDTENLMPLNKSELYWNLEVFNSKEIDNYITEQLTNTLDKLRSSQNLTEIFKYGIEGVSWKITDNLTFMNDDWSINFPTWKCEISSPYNQYHLLIMQLTHGLVVMSFCYPV